MAQRVVVALLVAVTQGVQGFESCDGYFHKADCLASESQCGWMGCM